MTLGLGSLLVDVVEAPVVVIVGWGAIGGEVLLGDPGVVDIGDEVAAHFVSALEQHVHSVVVADELGNAGGEGVQIVFTLVDPVV
jgi:hypothetical protein